MPRPAALLLALATAAMRFGAAHAQTSGTPATAAAMAEPLDSGAIVVTARLRREREADTPLAIAVRTGDTLDLLQARTVEGLAQSLPGLSFRTAASNKDRTLYIRGIGTATTASGTEPSVATVLDGVLLMRPGQQTLEVADIAQVEVLRGPQGTLFGKNASAGVINILTTTPTRNWSETGLAEATTDDEQRLKGTVSGPLGGSGAFQLTGLAARFAGNARNLTTGEKVDGYRRAGVRGKLQLEPAANLRIVTIADFAAERSSTPYAVYAARQKLAFGSGAVTTNPALDTALAAAGIAASPTNTASRGKPTRVDDTNAGLSVQADLTLSFAVLTSISAVRWWHNHQLLDLDGLDGPQPGIAAISDDGRLDFHQLSEELRLTSNGGGALQYVAGVFLIRGHSRESYTRTVTQIVPAGGTLTGAGDADWAVTSSHASAFGEVTLRLVPGLKASLGGRLIHDAIGYHDARTVSTSAPLPGVFPPYQSRGHTSHDDYSLRAALQLALSARAMAYASFTRGYKGPAYNVFFNMRASDAQPLAPETSRSYEIGLKGSALDERLSFSADLFLTRYSGFQASIADVYLGTPVVRLLNAGQVSTRGFEGELSLRPAAGVSLALDLTRIDAHIDHFLCPDPTLPCARYSLDGPPLPYAPKWQVFASAEYSHSLSRRLRGSIIVSYAYTSAMQYQLDEGPDTVQPGHGRIDASLAVATADRRYELRLFGRNLADRSYSTYLLPASISGGLLRLIPRDDRRYFGITLLARR